MSVLDDIEAGLYDLQLLNIEKAAQARIRKIRMSQSKTDFTVGTKVRFNELTGTKYMIGREGTIVSMKQKKVVVVLDKPVGRFAVRTADGSIRSAEITTDPRILDVL